MLKLKVVCKNCLILTAVTLLIFGYMFVEKAEAKILGQDPVRIDEDTFPDILFRSYVSSHFDPDGDGYIIDPSEVTEIDVHNRGITSLEGIEYFINLKKLDCYSNQLTELDVSKNPNLEDLDCSFNQLSKLDISKNPRLETLTCLNNSIVKLDISKNPNLEWLNCNSNVLREIKVGNHPRLTHLICNINKLTELEIGNCPSLREINCEENDLSRLDINNCPALEQLECFHNHLTELDVTHNPDLVTLEVDFDDLEKLDLSKNSELSYLRFNFRTPPSKDDVNLSKITFPENPNDLFLMDYQYNGHQYYEIGYYEGYEDNYTGEEDPRVFYAILDFVAFLMLALASSIQLQKKQSV